MSCRSAFGRSFVSSVVLLGCALLAPLAADEPRDGEVLFYRMLGAASNGPLWPRTRSVCSFVGDEKTSSTGMATSGFTEYPFRKGRIDYTFAETFAYFPRFVSGARVTRGRINTGDILIDHVYEPDACVWGASGREFVQTFVASGRELVSLTLLVATRPGELRAQLLEGGPLGPAVGPARPFRSGHSTEWGWARWGAGQAPLVPGRSYGVRIWRVDGELFRPYLHATGDAYPDGALWRDGQAVPGSDLGTWLVEEPEDVSRALVLGADADGWGHGVHEVLVVPRTPNLRLIDVTTAPVLDKCRDIVVRVWSTEEPARLLAGPKRNVACARPGTTRRGQLLFAEDELPVEVGVPVRVEIVQVPHQGDIPAPEDTVHEPLDVRLWAYGETAPGSLPAIHDLRWSYEGKSDLRVEWGVTHAAPVTVELTRRSPRETLVAELEPGATGVVFPELWRGHDHDLRLVATGPGGRSWRTPLYRLRPPGGPHPPSPPPFWAEHPEALPQIVPPIRTEPESHPIVLEREVPLVNAGFESGLDGWSSTPPGLVAASGEAGGVSPWSGEGMAVRVHEAGERREQVFEEAMLSQRVETVPGHRYLLSVRARTDAHGGPRGDTRVRLAADPKGGDSLGLDAGTQWYWTDGRWLRFEHVFRAEADSSTIAVGLFRWRDIDRAAVHVDHVRLYDLGIVDAAAAGAAPTAESASSVALTDPREEEGSDRVEAFAEAPSGWLLTGLGARAAGDNITTMWIRARALRADGTLGPPREIRAGPEPDAGLEALVELPEGFVATGFGARVAPEWDVKTLAVWGRKLRADGTLGEERELRGGVEPQGGLERVIRLPAGRVLTAAGLRCHLNDIAGIRARSVAFGATVAGAAER